MNTPPRKSAPFARLSCSSRIVVITLVSWALGYFAPTAPAANVAANQLNQDIDTQRLAAYEVALRTLEQLQEQTIQEKAAFETIDARYRPKHPNHRAAQSRLDSVMKATATAEDRVTELEQVMSSAEKAIVRSHTIINLKADLTEAHLKMAELKARYLDAYPGVIEIAAKISSLEASLERLQQSTGSESYELSRTTLEGRMARMRSELSAMEARYLDKHPKLIAKRQQLAGLEKELELLKAQHTTLGDSDQARANTPAFEQAYRTLVDQEIAHLRSEPATKTNPERKLRLLRLEQEAALEDNDDVRLLELFNAELSLLEQASAPDQTASDTVRIKREILTVKRAIQRIETKHSQP